MAAIELSGSGYSPFEKELLAPARPGVPITTTVSDEDLLMTKTLQEMYDEYMKMGLSMTTGFSTEPEIPEAQFDEMIRQAGVELGKRYPILKSMNIRSTMRGMLNVQVSMKGGLTYEKSMRLSDVREAVDPGAFVLEVVSDWIERDVLKGAKKTTPKKKAAVLANPKLEKNLRLWSLPKSVGVS